MISLTINWYRPQTSQRLWENEFALYKNLSNPSISKVIVWNRWKLPRWCSLFQEKIHYAGVPDDYHPTFSELMRLSNFYCPDIRVRIIANTDIYFDPDVSRYLPLHPSPVVFCLSRWERKSRMWTLYKAHTRSKDSQDAWIFFGKIPEPVIRESDFKIGYLGCDNRLAHVLNEHMLVMNPASRVRIRHVHFSQQRYIPRQVPGNVVPPPYHLIPAT